MSGSTCAKTMHWCGFDSPSGASIFADIPKRCDPVKKARFCGADPVIPFTIPFALGGTGMVKRKMGLSAETSHTSNCWMHFLVTLAEHGGYLEKS